ncbi:MAG: hypothetical protein U0183_10065 [Polyangiaceae bacterium]
MNLGKIARGAMWLSAAGGLAFAVVAACVPADTRPVPSSVFLTVAASPVTRQGLVTEDGWTITFDKVLVGIGRSSISSSCVRYNEANYDRVLEVSRADPQKLSVLYGIGRCDVRFRVGTPSSEALLGEGTTDADAVKMRTRAADRWVNRGGVGLEIAGVARRGAEEKRFDFVFRPQVRYSACAPFSDGGSSLIIGGDAGEEDIDAAIGDSGADAEPPPPEGIGEVLEGEAAIGRELRIEAETLFRPGGAGARFDPYAAADMDGDGTVTLEELVRVPIAQVRDGGVFEAGLVTRNDPNAPETGGRAVAIESLGDYVVVVLLPGVLRYGPTGRCDANLNIDLGRPDGGRDRQRP